MARYCRRMLTAFWMLAADRVPVRKVSRPSASGFCTSSRMRTDPSGLSSARSMRTPLAPTSMTDRTGGALAATGPADGTGARSTMGPEHRFQIELLLEQVALLSDRPFVERHVPPGARLQHEL